MLLCVRRLQTTLKEEEGRHSRVGGWGQGAAPQPRGAAGPFSSFSFDAKRQARASQGERALLSSDANLVYYFTQNLTTLPLTSEREFHKGVCQFALCPAGDLLCLPHTKVLNKY